MLQFRFHCVGKNAGIEPRTVASFAMTFITANNQATSYPELAYSLTN
jgi:hypothetical protein